MQPNSTEFIELEDFQRLGVRPYECRLTVIRQAAQRSSKGLAERQLKSPTEQVGLQLCRVATSTYRLLDPRQRADSNQRAYVGRILPNTIAHAAPANFHSGGKQSGEKDAFAISRMSDAQLIEMLEFDAPPIGEGPPEWQVALSDDDLLDPSRLSRTVKRFRMWAWRRRMLIGLVLCGALVGGLIALQTRSQDPSEKWALGQTAGSNVEALEADVANEQIAENQITDAQVIDTSTTPGPSTLAPAATIQSESRAEFGSTDADVVVGPVMDSSLTPPKLERIEPVEFPEIKSSAKQDTPVAESIAPIEIQPPMLEAADPDLAADVGHTLGSQTQPLRFQPLRSQPLGSQPLGSQPLGSQPLGSQPLGPPMELDSLEPILEIADLLPGDQPAPEEVAPKRDDAIPFPAPSRESIQTTRRELLQRLPEREQLIRNGDTETLIEQLDQFAKSQDAGSTEHFVTSLLAAEVSWLREDALEMEARLAGRLRQYDVDVFSQLTSTYRLASQSAATDAQRQHLVACGLVLAERIMLGQKSFDDYRSVVSDVKQVAEIIDDEAAMERVDSILKGLPQVQRLAESAARRMVDATKSDSGVTGRYLCLVLRRWDDGLDELAETSNVRIASVAADEVQFGGNASVQETLSLVKRWRRCAAIAKGREAESMNLHAFDLLEAALDDVKPIARIAIENQIEEIRNQVPPEAFAARRPLATEPEVDQQAVVPDRSAAVVVDPAKLGFKGRVLVDGKDVRVGVECRPNVGISSELFEKVAERLAQPVSSIVIDVSAEFELSTSQSVVVISAPVNQKIWIGDQYLSQASPAKIELQAGRHTIRWALQTVDAESAFLRVQSESGVPLKLAHPELPGELSKPTNWTVQVR